MSSMSDLATVFADVDPYPARHAGPDPVIFERPHEGGSLSRYYADGRLVLSVPSGYAIWTGPDPDRLAEWLDLHREGSAGPLAVLNAPEGLS